MPALSLSTIFFALGGFILLSKLLGKYAIGRSKAEKKQVFYLAIFCEVFIHSFSYECFFANQDSHSYLCMFLHQNKALNLQMA